MFFLQWTMDLAIQRGWNFFLICFILLSACGQSFGLTPDSPETIPPQPTVDSWITAIQQADQLLNSNPDLENHIYSYSETAVEINQHLVLVEHAKPASDLADELKKTDLPLIGNAWDILVEILDKALPDSGQALIIVDSGLREIFAFKGNLDSLSNLILVANESEAFRSRCVEVLGWHRAIMGNILMAELEKRFSGS